MNNAGLKAGASQARMDTHPLWMLASAGVEMQRVRANTLRVAPSCRWGSLLVQAA